MIFWRTDNPLTHAVADALKSCGIPSGHIRDFPADHYPASIFYGIMRGTGNIMHEMRRHGKEFWYIDNGYFDAEYVDKFGRKSMEGYFRFVKNDMIDTYTAEIPGHSIPQLGKFFLVMPPSSYTANFYDTCPADWSEIWAGLLAGCGFNVQFRDKGAKTSLHEDLEKIKSLNGAVLAFNSMSVMSALGRGIPVYDTHGIFRNADEIFKGGRNFKPRQMYAFDDVEKFYLSKQFTLKQIANGESSLSIKECAA